ncbi:MAG: CBS domain-containing protein [Saprospiraceae bacterium]|nr:CBS domain-containing protein [Saprospiraceae bacterium]
MKNEIVHRVYDFLKEYPPFSLLPKDAILQISSHVLVKFLPDKTTLFKIGEMPPSLFYIVNEGAIHLHQEDGQMVEHCDEGDVFGIRPLLAESPYLLTAQASEDTILYCIRTEDFLPYLSHHPKILAFLASNFAVGSGNMFYKKSSTPISEGKTNSENVLTELFAIDTQKTPIYCHIQHTIQEAAVLMANHQIGSIVVCDEEIRPIGIVTDKDLRIKVVAGDIRKKENISLIMSAPVICVKHGLSIAELQILMIKNRINHLAVTQDGTIQSKLIGVVSEHDLVVQQADNPSILIREIRKSQSGEQLKRVRDKVERLIKKYIEQEVSIPFITQVVSSINDEIIQQAIKISEHKLGKEIYQNIKYCWLALGSEGREEQLLRTDQDNALVYVQDDAIPDIKDKCMLLAKEVTAILNEVGYEYCPADMMASNPAWCQSVAEWQETFHKWIYQPGEKEIMMCTIFFDYRPVYGDISLASALTNYIFSTFDKQEVFLHLLAKNALENPAPLSFFRNFIVEKNGEHKDSFDIKLRAMMPLTDAARLLTLAARNGGENNTCKRFLALADIEPQNDELYRMAADAYEILIRIRTKHGFKKGDSGRYIQPDDMDKMERLLLRNAFQPIDELQKMIKVRFQLGGIL